MLGVHPKEHDMATDPRWIDEHGDEIDEDHRGLVYDIRTLIDRRRALGIFGGVALAGLLTACGVKSEADASASPSASASASATPAPAASATAEASAPLDEVPDETGGPYPGDGSNGVNVLDDSGIVRSDIRASFGSSSTVAPGVPLAIALTVRDAATGAALAGRGVYLWHCDRDGNYSLYSQGVENENYLRGVQETDANGTVTFTTIYPACYSGRWPHIHFEVYPSLANATNSANKIATSQMALPEAAPKAAYGTSGYQQSVSNLSRVSLQSDNVFSDGYDLQMPTLTGDPASGYQLTFSCAV